ncbi:MAG: prolyl oligopeptidase family serine peptidase [Saprospiraceae bacterium]|nr:prolyl oligopeptidase family serine peptidase [Saprospiraceae bacterium]
MTHHLFTILISIFTIGIVACNEPKSEQENERTGNYVGNFKHGDFSDEIQITIEKDSTGYLAFFSSLAQNANRIPLQSVMVVEDSINFHLQSDFFKYTFKNKWSDNNSLLKGSLSVDTVTVSYTLKKEGNNDNGSPGKEGISFKSDGLTLHGTIWQPINKNNRAIIILTSSGNADRSASRAEAIQFAKMGFTTFHYDKRGTGNSGGDWSSVTMKTLLADDMNAIQYFSRQTNIPLENIGIKGSSQGAAKVPYILTEMPALQYGIVVSCPGSSLLESDLNYWKNSNAELPKEDLEEAAGLQKKVFEFIAGKVSKGDLENEIKAKQTARWFENVWIPNLDETSLDPKLLYDPIPYFQTTKQPLLIIEGSSDEIIPSNSAAVIEKALEQAGNTQCKIVGLEGASHSMYFVGQSDFPYWSKIHPDYFQTIENWVKTVVD